MDNICGVTGLGRDPKSYHRVPLKVGLRHRGYVGIVKGGSWGLVEG